MIRIIFLIKIFILLILFPFNANSLTPTSSYLIVNSAFSSNDYETAARYLLDDYFIDFNTIHQKQKLISFVNTQRFNKAAEVSNQIINQGINDKDAWIVHLIDSKIKNQLKAFRDFQSLDKKLIIRNEFEIINYIFFKNEQLEKNNHNIAKSLLNLVQESTNTDLEQQGNIDYFLFYLSLALYLFPEFNEAIFLQARLFEHLKYYEKAESIYNSINVNHSLYFEAQKNIAVNKKSVGKFDEAKNILLELTYKNPENYSLKIALADLYRINKNYDNAIKYYTDFLEIKEINKEQYWRILYIRGICYERLNMWERAENDFLQALELESEQPQLLNYLAYGWIERNRFLDQSIEMLNLAIKNSPNSHYILDSLAWAYYKKRDLLRAVKIMENVIEIAPSEAISLDHLGDIYFELGRKREAYFMWTQARDLAEPEDDIMDSVQSKLDRFNG